VETDTPDLTAHLKTPDFFDVAKFPKATFSSTKIERDSSAGVNSYVVTGNFDLHGQSKSITFHATIEVTADNATNSASHVLATSLASVVLPVPGGPQRIIECSAPPSSRRRSGLPGAMRCN